MTLPPGAEILWRDPGLMVLHKPSGLSVLADRTGASSLWDMLETLLAADGLRPLAVHRIDKGTSGLLLVALERGVQQSLGKAFETGRVGKWYGAICHGALPPDTLDIDLPLAPGRKGRQRVAGARDAIAFDPERRRYHLPAGTELKGGARRARTQVRRCATRGTRSLLGIRLHSGRTHQIRVHLAWIGAPILGDHLYGTPAAPEQAAPRLALHCHRLTLPPLPDGIPRPVCFRSPLPADFRALLPG